jgi:hypothetical protein
MDDLLNREYNGWENRFTWLVHLHLSDEQVLSLEIMQVVAGEPNDGPAGRLVEIWVKSLISDWMNRFDQYACSRGGFLMASYEHNCRGVEFVAVLGRSGLPGSAAALVSVEVVLWR